MVTRALFIDSPVPYAEAAAEQNRLVPLRIADEIDNVVLFLEHPPVITMGRGGDQTHLLVSPEELANKGIDLFHSSRGGNITCHAPNQLVMYPILKLSGLDADVRAYVGRLEEVAIRTAASFAVTACRRDGMPGAWTEMGKIAAIGVRLKHWVTAHGLSFNISLDPSIFENIVPCGLTGEKVTSLQEILGPTCPTLSSVRDQMALHFGDVFNQQLEIKRVKSLTRAVSLFPS